MNTAALRKRREIPGPRALPIIAYFDEDTIARKLLVGVQRFRRVAFEKISQENHELNQIGIALSAEHDTEKLLEMILTKSREFTKSDAGSIYLVERIPLQRNQRRLPFNNKPTPEGDLYEERLRFSLAQNDSVDVPFRAITMEISDQSIAGYVALTGETVCIDDAYHLPPHLPYSVNRKFDEDSGYRTKSI